MLVLYKSGQHPRTSCEDQGILNTLQNLRPLKAQPRKSPSEVLTSQIHFRSGSLQDHKHNICPAASGSAWASSPPEADVEEFLQTQPEQPRCSSKGPQIKLLSFHHQDCFTLWRYCKDTQKNMWPNKTLSGRSSLEHGGFFG